MTAVLIVLPAAAQAEGLFDFLFGGFRRTAPPASMRAYAPTTSSPEERELPRFTPGNSSPPALAPSAGYGGPAVAYCVRTCDGYHFPLQRQAGASPAQMCNAFCPASATKVFYGAGIDRAAAVDGTRYADLPNAYVYRDKLVGNCTCNGKDTMGLARIDVSRDPTLRRGDLVAGPSGIVAYAGNRGAVAQFTPVPARTSRATRLAGSPR